MQCSIDYGYFIDAMRDNSAAIFINRRSVIGDDDAKAALTRKFLEPPADLNVHRVYVKFYTKRASHTGVRHTTEDILEGP